MADLKVDGDPLPTGIKEESWNVSEEAEHNVTEEENASYAELVKAFRCSTISATGQELTEDSTLLPPDLPITSVASPQQAATIDSLPNELLTNIFFRLFAKQLAQMRLVSKSWNALLCDSSFVKSHLDNSIYNKDQFLLAFNGRFCSCTSKPFTVHGSPSSDLQLTEFNPVNPESIYAVANIKVIGAVHGLVCYSSYDSSVIHIWNPSLSAVLTLPPSSTPPHRHCEIFLRFGFDPQTDDYTVVKITGIISLKKLSATDGNLNFPYSIKKWLQVEIYSMRKGSWEVITARVPSHFKMLDDMDQLCVDGYDGHLHWHCLCSKGGKTYFDSIATFDLGSNTFGEIRFPDSSTLNHHDYVNGVGTFAQKLCVLLQGDEGAYEVWVMNEYGVTESWVKLFAFSLHSDYRCPFGFTLHNELLIEHEEGYLVLYYPCANKTKYYKKFCCRKRRRPYKILKYLDSLVWVAPPVPK